MMTGRSHAEALIKERPVWAEVNLSAIKHNVHVLLEHNHGCGLMAVVKADAYGHGALAVAQAALEAGATWLGVASPDEGKTLRQAGIMAPILVLGAFYPGSEQVYHDFNLTATMATYQGAEALSNLARRGYVLSAHLKVDTGMGRIGFLPDEAIIVADQALQAGVKLEGVFTHLASADEADTSWTMVQLRRFRQVVSQLAAKHIHFLWRHAGNSAALLRYPMDDFTLTRAGIALYGLPPSAPLAGMVPLQPAMSLHALVVAVRRLPAGSSISYGRTYSTTRETTIAVLPVGYADGYTRRLTHHAMVLIGGRCFPVVGTICMDQCMVDVGDYPVQIGEPVVLMGRQGYKSITADDLASWSGTINYEIVCSFSTRVPRLYTQNGA